MCDLFSSREMRRSVPFRMVFRTSLLTVGVVRGVWSILPPDHDRVHIDGKWIKEGKISDKKKSGQSDTRLVDTRLDRAANCAHAVRRGNPLTDQSSRCNFITFNQPARF